MNKGELEQARRHYLEFLLSCQTNETEHRLTVRAEPTIFATCFWIFGLQLLQRHDLIESNRKKLGQFLRSEIRFYREKISSDEALSKKPYKQLLCFTLSALSILKELKVDPLEELVNEQIPESVSNFLERLGCLNGTPQSGNHALFLGVFLIHCNETLGLNYSIKINEWIDLHLKSMNRFGFWGVGNMTTLMFQNGYHQYEILHYLGVNVKANVLPAQHVLRLGDKRGQFAPYPGGGGCYDYDAVYILTEESKSVKDDVSTMLQKTASTLLAEQNEDGGFCECKNIRPRNLENIMGMFKHSMSALPNFPLMFERSRHSLALQRPKYNRISTHWSEYDRMWDESNLWDSWFRMLAIARIEIHLKPERIKQWGFIPFPGVGFHSKLKWR